MSYKVISVCTLGGQQSVLGCCSTPGACSLNQAMQGRKQHSEYTDRESEPIFLLCTPPADCSFHRKMLHQTITTSWPSNCRMTVYLWHTKKNIFPKSKTHIKWENIIPLHLLFWQWNEKTETYPKCKAVLCTYVPSAAQIIFDLLSRWFS